ncbi:MAG: hypothetical protein B6I31_00980 [Desulfobacteraceae bacterium 4572_19]|nr:MAG: hypothetical protein B6I31_00980 [Desulfobacteraceae bacterium 4572_19]
MRKKVVLLGFCFVVMLTVFVNYDYLHADKLFLNAPVMKVTTAGTNVEISWNNIFDADGYTLYYAPYPDASYVGSFDMGDNRSLSACLPVGFGFYVAVKAYKFGIESDFSNIDYFVSKSTPVYMTVVLHYEENFNTAKNYYHTKREELLELATYLRSVGITLNLQPDWAFLECVRDYDDEFNTTTGGKTIIQYLKEDLGHEIDPHAHEKNDYNIADVAYLIQETGVVPSTLVGGMIVDPVEDSKYNYFLNPIQGRKFPFYSWQAETLWGGGTSGHVNDVYATGVWHPKDAENFYTNDDTSPLPCIGKYINTFDGLYDLIEKLDSCTLEQGKIYTSTVFIGQGEVEEYLYNFKNEIAKLNKYKEEGKLIFSSLGTILNVWETEYNSEYNIFINESERVEAPIINITQINGKSRIVMGCDTEGAQIRYTFDTASPTLESTLYTEPIFTIGKGNVKAKAYKDGCITSRSTDGVYGME